MGRIYLDHSATTQLDRRVFDAMAPFHLEKFGNSSSIHSEGQEAFAAVDKAREETGRFLNCDSDEIIFTSGATESDNMAIFGLVRALQKRGTKKMHLITSAIEHPAVLECFRKLEKSDDIDVTYLSVDDKGKINLQEVQKCITQHTMLVSIMYVNSEVGSIQPIEHVGEIVAKVNANRKKKAGGGADKLYFHSDATQAINYLDCDTKKHNLDLLSLSAHKIYGPKGVGALFAKKGTPLESLQLGGHQESNRRSGTLNVPGIVGLGAALEIAGKERENNNEKISVLRDQLVEGLTKKIPNANLNTDLGNASPSHAHFSFAGAEGEAILFDLDFEGIEVSTGSACASGDHKASHVLLEMGIPQEIAHCSIRFTLGKNTTEKDVKKVLKVAPKIIERLRKIAPSVSK